MKEPQSDNTPTDPEVKEPQSNNTPTETIPELLNDIRGTSSSQDAYSTNDVALGG